MYINVGEKNQTSSATCEDLLRKDALFLCLAVTSLFGVLLTNLRGLALKGHVMLEWVGTLSCIWGAVGTWE